MIAASFEPINGELCGPYGSSTKHMIQKELNVVKEFMELIRIVDSD